MSKLIYVSGPMTGYKNFNFPAFDEAALNLMNKGWRPVNPANIDRAFGFDGKEECKVTKQMLGEFLSRDIIAISKCDAIFLMKGWQDSKGANIELDFAKLIGIEVYEYTQGYPSP